MSFENARKILRSGSSPLTAYKLLLMQGACSRPGLRFLFEALLMPFSKSGIVSIRYNLFGNTLTSSVRVSDLDSDFMSTRELVVEDVYALNRNFRPDLVVDGGGNIGLFTLRAVHAFADNNGIPVQFVICEPLPRNINQIKTHLAQNSIVADLRQVCIGGASKTIPFYCREANQSSFDATKPYASVIDIPAITLADAVGTDAKQILIKLDIEGMEVEALSSFIPHESRPVYLVGELHDVSSNAQPMRELFDKHGWTLRLGECPHNICNFWGCSPAALPSLSNLHSQPVTT